MKNSVFTLLLAFACLSAWAQESQTAYNFLRLPASARSAALGGENISLVEDDPSLVFSNPALLSSVSDKSIGFNYMNYMSGANMLSASFSRIVKEKLSWAASAQYIGYGSMRQTTEDNVQTGEFSAKDIAVAGHLSYMLSDKIVGGITAKFITSYIGDYNSIAVGVDLGLNYFDAEHNFSLSAVAKNLGGQLKAYDENFEKMPLDLQVGASKQFAAAPFRVHATLVDLNHWNYKFINHLVVGADILLGSTLWVGGGYNFRRADEMSILATGEEKGSSHGAGLSFGGGVNLERFKLNVAYGKYHVSSSSIVVSAAYSL